MESKSGGGAVSGNPRLETGTLRILHVVDSLERGGLERNVADIAIAQQRAGEQVQLHCLYRTGPIALELEAQGIAVTCSHKRDGRDPRPMLRLRSAIRRHRSAIVHSHNLVPNYYCATALRLLWRPAVLVNTCHDMGTRLSDTRLQNLYRWSLRRTARVAMVAHEVKDRYLAGGYVGEEKACVIANGVQPDRFASSAKERLEARRKVGVTSDAPVIGSVGRLVPVKNHEMLIRAIPELARSFGELRLVLVGGGALESDLRRLAAQLGIEDRVIFAGERGDVASLLPAFDVFALPSHSEGRSISLLEASCAGLPIVATRVGGNPGIVEHGSTGLLVEPGDLPGFRDALAHLLRSRDEATRLGTAARAWATANASVEQQRIATRDFYEAALAHAGS